MRNTGELEISRALSQVRIALGFLPEIERDSEALYLFFPKAKSYHVHGSAIRVRIKNGRALIDGDIVADAKQTPKAERIIIKELGGDIYQHKIITITKTRTIREIHNHFKIACDIHELAVTLERLAWLLSALGVAPPT